MGILKTWPTFMVSQPKTQQARSSWFQVSLQTWKPQPGSHRGRKEGRAESPRCWLPRPRLNKRNPQPPTSTLVQEHSTSTSTLLLALLRGRRRKGGAWGAVRPAAEAEPPSLLSASPGQALALPTIYLAARQEREPACSPPKPK